MYSNISKHKKCLLGADIRLPMIYVEHCKYTAFLHKYKMQAELLF